MKTNEVLARNNLLVEELRRHKGAENAMTSEQAQAFLEEHGFYTKARNIGTYINRLMLERCLPICYINGKGYYWATKQSEIQATINDLQSRINALQEHIGHLKGFIIDEV